MEEEDEEEEQAQSNSAGSHNEGSQQIADSMQNGVSQCGIN